MNLRQYMAPEAAKTSGIEAKPSGLRYPSPFLSTSDAAAYLQVSKTLLQNLRTSGEGPAFLRVSARRVLYSLESLDAWLKANTHLSTAEYPTAQARVAQGTRTRRGRTGVDASVDALS